VALTINIQHLQAQKDDIDSHLQGCPADSLGTVQCIASLWNIHPGSKHASITKTFEVQGLPSLPVKIASPYRRAECISRSCLCLVVNLEQFGGFSRANNHTFVLSGKLLHYQHDSRSKSAIDTQNV
jgi:hypothetical protein